tara:strand:+ start:319 stop:453 length:135 start_codon:yes stop_codon:yes gene_type:complete
MSGRAKTFRRIIFSSNRRRLAIAAAADPSFDFSNANNSMYIALF